jgi:hypothetical protein
MRLQQKASTQPARRRVDVCVCLGVTCFNKYDTFMVLLINDPAGSGTTSLRNGVVLHVSFRVGVSVCVCVI